MDVMLDLETLSTSKNAAIIQIGAIAFDKTRKVKSTGGLKINIAAQSALLFGAVIDAGTTKFWREASPEAKLSVSGSGTYLSLPDALAKLSSFVKDTSPTNVWAHGPSFDIALLEHSYELVALPVPWEYNAPRDTRTLFDLAAETGWERPSRASVMVNDDVQHDALDDAIYQAACVQSAYVALWA